MWTFRSGPLPRACAKLVSPSGWRTASLNWTPSDAKVFRRQLTIWSQPWERNSPRHSINSRETTHQHLKVEGSSSTEPSAAIYVTAVNALLAPDSGRHGRAGPNGPPRDSQAVCSGRRSELEAGSQLHLRTEGCHTRARRQRESEKHPHPHSGGVLHRPASVPAIDRERRPPAQPFRREEGAGKVRQGRGRARPGNASRARQTCG